MLSVNSSTLLKKREGILGQFQKAIDGLKKVNQDIQTAQDKSVNKIESLNHEINLERQEVAALDNLLVQNDKTIEKMSEFLQ